MNKITIGVIALAICATLVAADEDTKVQEIAVPVNKCEAPTLSIAINDIE